MPGMQVEHLDGAGRSVQHSELAHAVIAVEVELVEGAVVRREDLEDEGGDVVPDGRWCGREPGVGDAVVPRPAEVKVPAACSPSRRAADSSTTATPSWVRPWLRCGSGATTYRPSQTSSKRSSPASRRLVGNRHQERRVRGAAGQGRRVKANVLFFDKRPARPGQPWTTDLWVYDLRTNSPFTQKQNPLRRQHLDEFVDCYRPGEPRSSRVESERFHRYSYDELVARAGGPRSPRRWRRRPSSGRWTRADARHPQITHRGWCVRRRCWTVLLWRWTVEALLMAPAGPEWTHDDLDALPEGGLLRYELVDGQLLVSPPPSIEHQRVSGGRYRLLVAQCPPGLEVLYAPPDFRPTSRRSLQPDLLVFRRAEAGEKRDHLGAGARRRDPVAVDTQRGPRPQAGTLRGGRRGLVLGRRPGRAEHPGLGAARRGPRRGGASRGCGRAAADGVLRRWCRLRWRADRPRSRSPLTTRRGRLWTSPCGPMTVVLPT